MSHIVLSYEQLQALTQATGLIEARDPSGRCIGYLEFNSEQEIAAECKRRRQANERTFSFEQIRAHLRVLDDAAKQGNDEQQLWDLLARLQNEPRT